jgi:hypothetical protein
VAGMLLEHASKKDFAVVFTNNYGDIIKDFIQVVHLIVSVFKVFKLFFSVLV